MTERPHLSVSSARQYVRCAAQWKMQRVDGMTLASTVPAIRGTGVHQGAAHNYRQKIETGRDLPLREVTDVAVESVEVGFAGPVHLSDDEVDVGIRLLRDRAKDQAADMARAYHLRTAPHVRPVAVEEMMRVTPDPDILPVDVVGRVDVIDDQDRVRDIKTKEKPPREGEEHGDVQLTMYALLFHAQKGRLPSAVGFDVVQQHGTAPARAEWRPSHRGIDDLKAIVARLQQVQGSIQAGHFPPTDPGNWWCSNRWCGFWNICPYVAGNRRRDDGTRRRVGREVRQQG